MHASDWLAYSNLYDVNKPPFISFFSVIKGIPYLYKFHK